MNFRIFALLLALLLLTANAKKADPQDEEDDQDEDHEDQITTMTFLVEHEQEQENDYIQINLIIKTQDSSLTNALSSASALVASVTAIGQNYCQSYPEDDAECDEVVDAGDFEIEAKYQPIRKQLTFVAFIVTYDVTISVYHTEKIGELADQLLKAGVSQIESFEWASSEEDDSEQAAIEAGKQKSHDMCFHLGMKLHRIVSVDMVEEDDEGDGGDGGDDEQQEEEDEDDEEGPLVYEFQVQCILDEQTAAKKQAEEEAERAEEDDEDDDDQDDEDDQDEDQDEEEEEEQEEQQEEEKPKKKGKKGKKK